VRDEPKSELARYAFGFSDKKPGKLFWAIHAGMVIFIVWSFWSQAHAAEMCDFEHRCYADAPHQTYHMDLGHPDRETPPPAPMYPAPKLAPAEREMSYAEALAQPRWWKLQHHFGDGL
jgi:hypothetical protein